MVLLDERCYSHYMRCCHTCTGQQCKTVSYIISQSFIIVLFLNLCPLPLHDLHRLVSNDCLPVSIGSKALRGLQAAHIWCPGARISGLSTSTGWPLISIKSGPLEENLLTIGARPSKNATLPSPIAACAQILVTRPVASLRICCS